ncbi:LysR family transcriptional regulator, partial [Aliarcobacter cryaerophilus]
ISNYIMPNIYYDFLSKYKDVKLDILTINSSSIIDKILKNELDIGLIEVDTQNSSLIKEKLADDELIVVSSDEKHPSIAFIDAIKKRWILREIGSGTREIFMSKIGEIAKVTIGIKDLKEYLELFFCEILSTFV